LLDRIVKCNRDEEENDGDDDDDDDDEWRPSILRMAPLNSTAARCKPIYHRPKLNGTTRAINGI